MIPYTNAYVEYEEWFTVELYTRNQVMGQFVLLKGYSCEIDLNYVLRKMDE
jgi:hypothetical protein